MRTRNKLLTLLILSTAAISVTEAVNRIIKIKATSGNLLSDKNPLCFSWRLGNIHYTKTGSGSPILLIHDMSISSSGYEWNKMVSGLSKKHTVYIPDLIGCGRSEKPDMTYTNFLYVQMISDFIKNEIGKRTSVIATGASAPALIMACKYNPEYFDKIVLISPESPESGMIIPGKRAKTYKFILNLPVIGTVLYNIAASKRNIEESFASLDFYNPYSIDKSIIDSYYESSHLGASPKSLYASIVCNYTRFNIKASVSCIDNSIAVISGSADTESAESALEYIKLNPSIEAFTVDKCRRLPQLEAPDRLLKQLEYFL